MSKSAKKDRNVRKKKTFTDYWEKYSTVAILVLMVCVFGILEPQAFMTGSNFIKIIEQSSITILLACGEFFAILLAGIDLSVGSILALSGVVTAKLMVDFGMPPAMAVLIGTILLGILIGGANGFLINVTGLPPFIITLGMQSILRGLTMIVSNARAVSGVPIQFTKCVGGRIFDLIPIPIIIVLITAGIFIFFTMKTQAGRNLYAVGGNQQAAWYAGINVKKHFLLAFMISGLCAGMAGMVNVARLAAAEPTAGTGYDTHAIAAVIIGGTSFFGGQGMIPKVVVGGLIIGVINNGLNMVGLSSYYQTIAMGVLIIAAVTLDRFFGSGNKR